MRDHDSDASQSALFFALVAAVLTAALGFAGSIAMSIANANTNVKDNDNSGPIMIMIGLYAAPFAGSVAGLIRYNMLMSRHR